MKKLHAILFVFYLFASIGAQGQTKFTVTVGGSGVDAAAVRQIVRDSLSANTLYLDTADFTGSGTSGSKLKINTGAIRTYLQSLSGYAGSGAKVLSDNMSWVTSSGTNAAPVASSVTISGTFTQGQTLSGSATYTDAEGDAAGTPVKKWYSYTNTSGAGATLLATAATYTLQAGDVGKYIRLEYTPTAATGTSPGTAVFSSYSTAVASSGGGGGGAGLMTIATPTTGYTESPTGTFTSTSSGVYPVLFNQTIASGATDTVYFTVNSGNSFNAIGVDVDNTIEAESGWTAFVYHNDGTGGTPPYTVGGGGVISLSAITLTNGNLLGLAISPTIIGAIYSTNGGATWTPAGSTGARPAGVLTIKAEFNSSGKVITNPTLK